jgi:acetyltransferase-like isoleucine patch superfamily enzyme
VFIDESVTIGCNCKIQNGSNIYKGSVIGSGVFIGPGVILANDRYPSAINEDGSIKTADDWLCEGVTIEDGVSLGAGAIILPGVTIRSRSVIGAGAVVCKDVDAGTHVGIPARNILT